MRKFVAIYNSETHRKSTDFICSEMHRSGFKVSLLSIDEVDDFSKQDLVSGDVILLAMGGKDFKRLYTLIRSLRQSVIILSNFPGILGEEQFDVFLTRIKSDYVLLNSRLDARRYEKVCRLLRVPCNGVLFGLSSYSPSQYCNGVDSYDGKEKVVFLEQVFLPKSIDNKRSLVVLLHQLASLNHHKYEIQIKIHPLTKVYDSELSLQALYDVYLKSSGESPKVVFVDIPLRSLMADKKVVAFLSITSSGLLEAILEGKKVGVVTDFYKEKDSTGFFKRSGLEIQLKSLRLSKLKKLCVDDNWSFLNVYDPRKGIQTLLSLLGTESHDKRLQYQVPRFSILVFKFILCFPKTFMKHPKLSYKRLKLGYKVMTS